MIPYLAILAILASPAMAQGSRYAFQSDNKLCLGGMNEDDGLKMKVADCSENQNFDINFGETQVKVNHDNHDKCLDAGWEAVEGSQPTFEECNGADSQKFFMTNDGRIALMDRGLCIDAQDFHVELDKNIVLNTCRDGQASQGLLQVSGNDTSSEPTGPGEEDYTNGGPWKIPTAVNTEMCLDEYNDNIEVRPCTYGDTNPWYMFKGDTPIRSAADGKTDKCLTVVSAVDGQITDGAKLMLETCRDGDTKQTFHWTDDNRLSLRDSGLCIDVPGANAWPGAPLQLWTCGDGNTAQEWPVELAASNSSTADPGTGDSSNDAQDGGGENYDAQDGGDQSYDDQAGDDQSYDDQAGGDEDGGDQSGGDEDGGDQSGGDENGGDQSGGDENYDDANGDDQNSGDQDDDASRDDHTDICPMKVTAKKDGSHYLSLKDNKLTMLKDGKDYWTFRKDGSATRIKLGDQCLSTDLGDDNADSLELEVVDCDDNPGQQFVVEDTRINVLDTDWCLKIRTVVENYQYDGAQAVLVKCGSDPETEEWLYHAAQPTCTDGEDQLQRVNDGTDITSQGQDSSNSSSFRNAAGVKTGSFRKAAGVKTGSFHKAAGGKTGKTGKTGSLSKSKTGHKGSVGKTGSFRNAAGVKTGSFHKTAGGKTGKTGSLHKVKTGHKGAGFKTGSFHKAAGVKTGSFHKGAGGKTGSFRKGAMVTTGSFLSGAGGNIDHRRLCPSLLFHKDNSNKCLIWNFLDNNDIDMVDCSKEKVGWTYDATASSTQIKRGDSCLTADQSDPNSMPIYVTDCIENDADQKFTVDGGRIKLENTNMCLDVNFKSAWTPKGGRDSAEYIYAAPSLLPCNNSANQSWNKRPYQPTCTDGDEAGRRYENTAGYTKPEQHP
ncbi:hypothetical protein CspHIS471_0400550 [Cutaneotrichosporon sp. HIS471]|nr:hypothetical protein CspHIS471_0400550 [Cutaneotrichosporon sp. HIS471]